MNMLHAVVAVGLALLAAFGGVFYLGSEEQLTTQLRLHFWETLGLRFGAGLLVGMLGLACWWLLNLVLGLLRQADLLRKMAWVVLGPVVGALAGALFFCLA